MFPGGAHMLPVSHPGRGCSWETQASAPSAGARYHARDLPRSARCRARTPSLGLLRSRRTGRADAALLILPPAACPGLSVPDTRACLRGPSVVGPEITCFCAGSADVPK